jgi:hypothetical protein
MQSLLSAKGGAGGMLPSGGRGGASREPAQPAIIIMEAASKASSIFMAFTLKSFARPLFKMGGILFGLAWLLTLFL